MAGSGSRLTVDGEYLTGKGVGMVRIQWHSLKIDLFTTHLISYKHSHTENSQRRYIQALVVKDAVETSDADVKIFAGECLFFPSEYFCMYCTFLSR